MNIQERYRIKKFLKQAKHKKKDAITIAEGYNKTKNILFPVKSSFKEHSKDAVSIRELLSK